MGKATTTIKIDGNKLRSLLESTTNKSIYEIATESGYTSNVIANSCKKGYASSAVQNIARLYGITPDAYKVNEEEPVKSIVKDPEQISFDDLGGLTKDDIKDAIREALIELTPSLTTLLTDVIKESVKKAFTAAIEDDVEYLCAEVGRASKGNTRAAIKEALTDFGWTTKTSKGDKK